MVFFNRRLVLTKVIAVAVGEIWWDGCIRGTSEALVPLRKFVFTTEIEECLYCIVEAARARKLCGDSGANEATEGITRG